MFTNIRGLDDAVCIIRSRPRLVPTKVLKACASSLSIPLAILANRILETGLCPEVWTTHRNVPLHKKNAFFQAENDRGIHMIAPSSKAAERLLGMQFRDMLPKPTVFFGPNQFAYMKQRGGARDAPAFLVMT